MSFVISVNTLQFSGRNKSLSSRWYKVRSPSSPVLQFSGNTKAIASVKANFHYYTGSKTPSRSQKTDFSIAPHSANVLAALIVVFKSTHSFAG